MNRSQPGTASNVPANKRSDRPAKRAYEAPTLSFLGSVSDLTRGANGNSPDGAIPTPKATG
jgi:hypothetical protein